MHETNAHSRNTQELNTSHSWNWQGKLSTKRKASENEFPFFFRPQITINYIVDEASNGAVYEPEFVIDSVDDDWIDNDDGDEVEEVRNKAIE